MRIQDFYKFALLTLITILPGCKGLTVLQPNENLIKSTISGKVVERNSVNQGVEDARVELIYVTYGSQDPYHSYYDMDIIRTGVWGGFYFTDIPSGTYSVIITKHYYIPIVIRNIVVPPHSNISLGPIPMKNVGLERVYYNYRVEFPHDILGIPDERCSRIGPRDTLIVDFGENGTAVNGPSDDLRIVYGSKNPKSMIHIYGADSPSGPWSDLGYNRGDIDLADYGLQSIRYIKIVSPSTSSGYTRVDAIIALNYNIEYYDFDSLGHKKGRNTLK